MLFKPFGSFPFLHIHADVINERFVPAHETAGDELYGLQDHICVCEITESKLEASENRLIQRFDKSKAPGTNPGLCSTATGGTCP